MPKSTLDVFETPLYRVSDAAAYLGVPQSTFQTWARGYRRPRATGRTDTAASPVITSVPAARGEPTIPFVGLAEGLVLAAVREAGVPLQRIRPAIDFLRTRIGMEHALASRRLYTDGAEIIFDFGQESEADANTVRDLVVVRNGQRVFSEIVERYLSRLEFGNDNYVRLIHLPEYAGAGVDVVADPERSFGQPIFAHGGAKVIDVLDRFRSGEQLVSLAEDFGLTVPDLENVLRVVASRVAA